MEELRARLQILAAKRDEIAAKIVREHHSFEDEEMNELIRLDAAITAGANALNRLSPPQETTLT